MSGAVIIVHLQVIFLSLFGASSVRGSDLGGEEFVAEFSDPSAARRLEDEDNIQFRNIAVDRNTGTVYLGGINRLYQLSPDLKLIDLYETGPKEDSPSCHFGYDCPPYNQLKLANDYNKAVVIDYDHSRLVSCGSLFQGICTLHSLGNISAVEAQGKEPVAANSADDSTVVFIAPGPPNPPLTQVMYSGVTYTGNSPFRSEVPAVSSRSLEPGREFKIASTSATSGTQMYVNSLVRDRYPINYVHGFQSQGFSYFLTNQMERTRQSPVVSKIVRVCQDDQAYYSYTEVPIHCKSEQGKDYNLLQAAYVDKAGAELAANLGITSFDVVLFAVFSTADSSQGIASQKPSNESAICVYPMNLIRKTFQENIQQCMSGKGDRGLDFISPSVPCINTRPTYIGEGFCGLDVNTPFGGSIPVLQAPLLTINEHLTAIAATTDGDDTIAFIGTDGGHLKKAKIESATNGTVLQNITIESGSAVQSPLLFDLTKDHLYVMTSKALKKINVKSNCIHQNSTQDSDCTAKQNSDQQSLLQKTQPKSRKEVRIAVAEFSDPAALLGVRDDDGAVQFTNLEVDKLTGRVYLGGVNRLYQLSSNLDLQEVSETGPKLDHPYCAQEGSCYSGIRLKLTDNHNKILVIDYAESRLIECGSLFQGICSMRSLGNISDSLATSEEIVAANSANASTVSFIGPGPPNPPITQVLYVGVTYSGIGPYRSWVPAVASRSLDSNNLLNFASQAVASATCMDFTSVAQTTFPVNYVYGFSSGGFSYFLTTQRKNRSQSEYSSKIVRICQNDQDYLSYTEVPLQCTTKTGEDYTLVQAAYTGKPGKDLAAQLGVTVQDDVLFAAFSPPDTKNLTGKSIKKSAVCVYTLKSIRQNFKDNIERCMNGEGMAGLDHISRRYPCIDTRMKNVGEDFCGLDVNSPFGGEIPVNQPPVLQIDAALTAITATAAGNNTVVYLGTSDGHLSKAMIESSTEGNEYAKVPVNPGSAVQSPLLFDLKKEHLYVLTSSKLSKVQVQNCLYHKHFPNCIQDPHCGWCAQQSECSIRESCKQTSHWIPY